MKEIKIMGRADFAGGVAPVDFLPLCDIHAYISRVTRIYMLAYRFIISLFWAFFSTKSLP